MMMQSNDKLDPEISDILYELSNVGVGQASIALGKMLGKSISIGIPKIKAVQSDIDEIIRDDPEKVAIGILMSLENTLSGAVLFIIDNVFLSEIVAVLTGVQYSGEELVQDEDSLSAISEIANIMAAAYMKAIGAYTGIRIYLSPVMVGIDMIGALITYPVARLGISNETAICVDTSFAFMDDKSQKTAGRIIMFPNDNSVSHIIKAIQN